MSDEAGAGAVVAALVALWGAPAVVCWLKAKYLWAIFGWLLGPWHWIPALRLAKPGSWWARRFYSPEKLAAARARFPAAAPASDAAATAARFADDAATGRAPDVAAGAPQSELDRRRLARDIGLDG